MRFIEKMTCMLGFCKKTLFLVLFLFPFIGFSQTLSELEPQLAALANTMVKDTFIPNRLKAAEAFKPLLLTALQQKDAFRYRFDSLVNVSIKMPDDSAFRIFTWQVIKDPNTYIYEGAIQMKGKKPKVIPLSNKYTEIEEKDFEECSPEHWCGGLVYKIKTFQGKGGKNYLVFTYNTNSLFERTKFVEVWKYKDAKFAFGLPFFFQNGKETRRRITMTYGAEAKTRMNYDEATQMIVFDHLVSQKSEVSGVTMVPDGDFEGYRLEKGVWQYVSDAVKTTPMSAAPVPAPVLDKRRNRNIMGKRN